MKPDWDKLMTEFEGNADGLVADVDCTSDGGKPICEKVGVKGYPTIKWGDVNELAEYEGGRDLAALQTFASENLKPLCGPKKLELCDESKKKEIKSLMARSDDDLAKEIKDKEATIAKAVEKHKGLQEKLSAKYKQYSKEKTDTVDAIKASGLGLMKSVLASQKKKEL